VAQSKSTIPVFGLDGESTKTVSLPPVFATAVRRDVIRRAVVAIQSHRVQPQGRDIFAGMRTSAESRGTGLHLARVPRVKGTRSPRAGQGAIATMTVGGRSAHTSMPEKKIYKRINRKERLLAVRSAIAATGRSDLVASRGHASAKVKEFPLVVVDEIESLKDVESVKGALEKLGVWEDILRAKSRVGVRAGVGKRRGRRAKKAVGPLVVVAEEKGIRRAARNLSGVDVVKVERLSVEALAPGTHPGRLTVWSESALKKLNEIYE